MALQHITCHSRTHKSHSEVDYHKWSPSGCHGEKREMMFEKSSNYKKIIFLLLDFVLARRNNEKWEFHLYRLSQIHPPTQTPFKPRKTPAATENSMYVTAKSIFRRNKNVIRENSI